MKNITLDDLINNGQLTPLGRSVVNDELVIDEDLKKELIRVFNEMRQSRKYSKDRGVCADW